jgi:capsular polysaccharide biosynthesis protein
VELREAAQRILWHYKLLIICVGIGVLVPFMLSRQQQPTYEASMRLLVSPADGTAVTADTVAAIATSRTQLAAALRDVGVQRDPETFAGSVSVRSVGASGMVDLSVTDEDPVVASAVANSLTTHVVQVLRSSGLAQSPLPSVVGSASPATTTAVAPSRVQDIVFGGLLGLVLGIVIAALLEAFNPTVIGKRAIADELQAPVLGVLPNLDGKPTSRELPWVRWQLGAQAMRSGVGTVELTTAGPSLDLAPLSIALHRAAVRPRKARSKLRTGPGGNGANGTAVNGTATNGSGDGGNDLRSSRPAPKLQIRVLDRTDKHSFHSNGAAGIVVVTPTVVKRTDMESAKELLGTTGWPAVGVIAYRRSRIARSLDRMSAKAEAPRRRSRLRRHLPWKRTS